MLDRLEALGRPVDAGNVRALGVSNETRYRGHEFVRLAEAHGLPRQREIRIGAQATLGSARGARRRAPPRRARAWVGVEAIRARLLQREVAGRTVIGVTSVAQLDEELAAWSADLPLERLAAIDAIRSQARDPAF